jgi:hypothetical protein
MRYVHRRRHPRFRHPARLAGERDGLDSLRRACRRLGHRANTKSNTFNVIDLGPWQTLR